MGPGTLYEILKTLPVFEHPDLLVSGAKLDDAGVYRLNDDLALIQTVDFFTPMVDEPYLFGEIAAANALSDVYAMGGTPLTAMNITAFPTCSLDLGILRDILAGGASKVQEAGALLVGGHTIEDKEPKYGLAVTGTVHPQRVVTNQGAKPGDLLVLTKPVGVGIITTAIKAGEASRRAAREAADIMRQLNNKAAQVMVEVGVNACTDITGFGLIGHIYEICVGSNVGVEIEVHDIPVLEAALEYARMGLVPGGAYVNRRFLEEKIHWVGNVPEEIQDVLFDPQTSGGLLIVVPQDKANRLTEKLEAVGVKGFKIGRVTDEPSKIRLEGD
ncbi:selenide, water dikinase [Calderihabitans maritimus]|uniref:Selenide, water dikinase n=1 Tax=Calderihabitans maritimus TaxID=1246530 RepID=A0A1Z5HVY3_9FIRM|nr:selenide, water dikinase [Calderihabitans maritimus]